MREIEAYLPTLQAIDKRLWEARMTVYRNEKKKETNEAFGRKMNGDAI